MRKFLKGLLVGVGVGLLIAPMKGEELRRMLSERASEWRRSLPEDSLVNQCTQQVSDRVMYTREHWRDYAQRAASVAKDASATLGSKAMHTGQDMANKAIHTGQDVAGKAKQSGQGLAGNLADKAKHTSQDLAGKAKQSAGFGRHPDGTGTRVVPEDGESRSY